MSTSLIIIVSVLASFVAVSNCIVNRPPKVPANAQWLNNMPRGNEFNPPRNQPVVEVNYVRCMSSTVTDQMVEYMYAEVKNTNLGRGTETNKAIRDWVARIGQRGDDAGHIIGKNEGGLGTVEWNIFPQSRNFNRGVYVEVGKVVNNAAKRGGLVQMWFRFTYGDRQYPCRPVSFDFYLLGDRLQLSDSLDNPYNNALAKY